MIKLLYTKGGLCTCEVNLKTHFITRNGNRDWVRGQMMSIYTRILKISIKNFKGFRNVRKSIETSDDISVATLTHRILRGSEVLNPVE